MFCDLDQAVEDLENLEAKIALDASFATDEVIAEIESLKKYIAENE